MCLARREYNNLTMRRKRDPVRSLRAIFIALFLVATMLIVVVEVVYYTLGESTVRELMIQTAVFLVSAALCFLGTYRLSGRLFQRLRQSEERWSRTFDTTSEGMFVLDRDLSVVQYNRAFAELIGKEEREILGKKCFELIHGTRGSPEFCVACRSIEEKRHVEEDLFEPNLGRYIHASADTSRDDRGEVEFILHTVRDITRQKEAEKLVWDGLAFRQNILDTIPIPVFYKNTDGEYLGCNRAFAVLVAGLPREEVVGKTAFDIYPPEMAKVHHGKDRELVQNPGFQAYESLIRYSDGTDHDVMMNKATYRDPGGGVAGLVGVVIDMTEQKQAESRISEAERKYRELAESLPQAVFETDNRGTLTYVNETALRTFGYSRDDVDGGLDALQVFAEEDRERVAGAILKMATGRSAGAERDYKAMRKDGTTFPCMVYSSLIADEAGAPLGIRGLLTDISELKEYQDELRRLNTELEGYAHTVSHDLKNPISKIAMVFELIETYLEQLQLDPGQRKPFDEAVAIGEQSVERTVILIDELLVLAEAGKLKQVEPVDVRKTVGEVLSEKEFELKEREVKVVVDPDLGEVRASPTHIYQLFMNLVRNSLQHNIAARPELEILRLADRQRKQRYLVRDNGPGLPADIIDDIFLPFTKGTGTGSTGIGLSIVAKIVATYGGEIKAYNDDGACFEFTLGSGFQD